MNWIAEQIETGNSHLPSLVAQASQRLDNAGFRTDAIDIVDADTLESASAESQRLVILMAAYLGKARLIDNRVVALRVRHGKETTMSKKVYCIAQFQPKPGQEQALFRVLQGLEPDTLREDGCLQYIVTRHIQSPLPRGELPHRLQRDLARHGELRGPLPARRYQGLLRALLPRR